MAWCEPKYKPEFCDIAIKVLADAESLAAVCDEIGVARSTLYLWRDKYEEFGRALDFGKQKSQRKLERIGMQGMVGDIEKFSPTPWIFTMKNRFREDYAEQKEEKSTNDSIVEQLLLGKKQTD
jgi:transposase-like protein